MRPKQCAQAQPHTGHLSRGLELGPGCGLPGLTFDYNQPLSVI